jgi:histidinol dehydrogenase
MVGIYKWNELSLAEQRKLLQRPVTNMNSLQHQVHSILSTVKERGDEALFEFTREFDGIELRSLKVSTQTIANAQICDEAMNAIALAIKNLTTNHQATKPKNQQVNTAAGISIEQVYKPIQKVGLYVPGGNNTPLISSLLMQAVPAQIAGCPIKILCTPPNSKGEVDPALLVAARLCGIDEIYSIGGAQAIAAMAYGTQSIPKVFKIFGPGNAYVTEAKTQVSLNSDGAAIDLPAGPSEVMVLADADANPEFVAADLLAQAEHGPDSHAVLLCDEEHFAKKVLNLLEQQAVSVQRKQIIDKALQYAVIIVCEHIQQQLDIINDYGPEHLIINRRHAEELLAEIDSAGSIFVGPWAAETMGDYITGSNHVLPTSGYAHAYSGLSCKDFMKSINIQTINVEGIKTLGPAAIILAQLEGLDAHAQAVQLRLNALEQLS